MFLPPRLDLPTHLTALANPTRLRILALLAERGEVGVNDLVADLRMSQPRISWHLRILRGGGAIRTRKDGRQVYCSLDADEIRRRQQELGRLLKLINQEVTT